ncbi:hypothetical protein [Phenylobacterium sp.]|uniref:hypothetical protein n=1 Tax=Phenylobacterium sp. TaxID=1871053 RepID=UPI0027307CF9|nr:hypothetical protein [Phenylobacterium sp.]MDP1615791.1 hypothetical protein [Phenylobacterium sp.]MDP1989198.1 hypothetical protein [Phenylobacterium sp.]
MAPLAPIQHSVSTWAQPLPPEASDERARLLAALAQQVCALGPGRLKVAVDGRTASGKTSFGHELAQALAARGRPVLRASLDDFKRPWRDRGLYDRESGEGYYRNAFDYEAVRRLLLTPMAGDGLCALCSIDPRTQIDHSETCVQAPPDAILVVDGVFAFRPELNDHWDLRVWLEIATAESIARGLARDGGDGSVMRDRYVVSEDLYAADVDPAARADVVIDNSRFDQPRPLRGLIA